MASISMPQYHPHIILVVNLSLDIYIIIDNINNPSDLINDLIIKVGGGVGGEVHHIVCHIYT